MPILFAFRENRFGFRFEIGTSAVLGRSPECDLILFDRASSRQHAQIFQGSEGYILRDLGSTNGTFHNDLRVEGEIPLKRNDEIRVGQELFLYDPDLDVAIGRESAVLIVGDVDPEPEGAFIVSPEFNLGVLDRGALTPLYQIASALSNRPKKGKVLKQIAYALTKIFGATGMILLWPETMMSDRFIAYLARPSDRRQVLPKPLFDAVIHEQKAVIWPFTLTGLDFIRGERVMTHTENTAMAVPLPSHGDRLGLLYVEAQDKVFSPKELNYLLGMGALIGTALANANLIDQLDYRLSREESEHESGGSFIGDDDQIKALLGTANQVGQTDAKILLTGEVGTGKEVLARRIHSVSSRRRGPYLSVNCATIPAGQIESTLFGQEEGAMTDEGTPGLLELADGGTIFIKNIEQLPLSAQAELLRALEEELVYRVGASQPRPSRFRTIASSNIDLDVLVENEEFREDLYRRLAEVTLELPPLREIKSDVITLARYFLARSARERGMNAPELDPAAAESLMAYPWPGNVGELKNVMDQMVMFARGGRITLDDLPLAFRHAHEAFRTTADFESEAIVESEKTLLRRALARANGAVDQASRILGIGEGDVEKYLMRHNITME